MPFQVGRPQVVCPVPLPFMLRASARLEARKEMLLVVVRKVPRISNYLLVYLHMLTCLLVSCCPMKEEKLSKKWPT